MSVTQSEAEPSTASLIKSVSPHLIRSLVAIIIGTLILRVAAQMMGQMLQFYFATIDRNYYDISHTTSGLITASFFITELLGALFLGALSDRYGRRLFIILGPLFGAVAVQITSMTVAIWLLVITRLLEGLSTASSIPSTLGYISEATSGRPTLRARIVGIFEMSFLGGIAIGAIAGGHLWEHLGQPAVVGGIRLISPAFSINGLVYLISLAVFAWGLKDLRHKPVAGPIDHRGKLGHYAKLLRSPRVWKFAPAWLAVNSILGMWINHSVRLLTGKDHYEGQLLTANYGPAEFGTGQAIFFVIFVVGVLGWSIFLGRYRKTSVMLIAVGGLFGTLMVVYSLNHLGSFSEAAYYPLMGLLVIGVLVTSGFTPAALVYLADITEAHTEDRGSIMGLYSVFLGVGQLVGTAAGGRFATWKAIDGLLLLSVILGAVTAVTLIALRRRETLATVRSRG